MIRRLVRSGVIFSVTLLLGKLNLTFAQNNCENVFEEKNGVVAVEAEHFVSKSDLTGDFDRSWYVTSENQGGPTPDPDPSHHDDASGSTYLEILPDTRVTHDDKLTTGVNFTGTPGSEAEVSYQIYFNTPGKYFVWVRCFSTGSEDNGVHVGLDGEWPASGQRMQWCSGKNKWTWESKQRTNANHCGEAQKIFLNIPNAGLHTITFSMREDGFEMDKFVLSQAYDKPSGNGPAEAKYNCDNPPPPPPPVAGGDVEVSGELKQWHKVTLTLTGPQASEGGNPNPFADYRLLVEFSKGNKKYLVPGYFAADGNAANSSADSGNKWRVHFAPDETGEWTYKINFHQGTDIALNSNLGQGTPVDSLNGKGGTIQIMASDKSGKDFRGKGRLAYVGEHYLQHMGNQEWFVKAGADAPENTLSYNGFDATPTPKKTWQPHEQDYNANDASGYTWKNGQGKGLLGAVAYLSNKNVNAISFLTYSLDGDDDTVYPHLQKSNNAKSWNDVHHDRFDVSKMDQWEHIFAYADKKGVFLHFKTQETENDQKMDGGGVGRERKLYYRELIARYGHHLALNWNMGEENTQTDAQRIGMAQYFADNDPYKHLVVIHTYPNDKGKVYNPLLGNKSTYTGASLQTGNATYNELHGDVKEWVSNSAQAGKKWVIALDEPGNASIGIDTDPDDIDLVRHKVLWATFMGGGCGVEYYYGYQSGCSDLDCEDHRTRDKKYTDAAHALAFFQKYFQPYLPNVVSDDAATSDNNDYVLKATNNSAWVVYRPSGDETTIDLPNGNWQLAWYNPRNGSMMQSTAMSGNTLSAPDNNDWVAFITNGNGPPPPPPPGGDCDNNYTYNALTDFPQIDIQGFVPAYKDDTRGALAVNAAQYKDQFAAARMTFQGDSGRYDITVRTLLETDGESTYRLVVGGNLVGTFTNPETNTDYTAYSYKFSDVVVDQGAMIQVEFNTATNGKIPDGNTTAYSRGRWTQVMMECKGDTTPPPPPPPTGTGFRVKARTMLEGYLNAENTAMQVEMNAKGLIPKAQPFNKVPRNYAGMEAFDSIAANVIDWVLVQVRDSANSAMIIKARAALLTDSGKLYDLDGQEGVLFDSLAYGHYYLAIHTRGHLPVISAQPIMMNMDMPEYDFTTGADKAKGVSQLKSVGAMFVQYSGDFDSNGNINNIDFNLWKQDAATIDQYLQVDGDGNGIINNLDFNLWKANRSKISEPELQ